MNPNHRAGEAVPYIHPDIDDLIDTIEDGGAFWFVIGGSMRR